jgi:hypothetical protein
VRWLNWKIDPNGPFLSRSATMALAWSSPMPCTNDSPSRMNPSASTVHMAPLRFTSGGKNRMPCRRASPTSISRL